MRVAFNSPARNQFLGESFNGRTAGLQPANEGSIPSSSTKFAREAVAPHVKQRRAGVNVRTSTFDSCSWHHLLTTRATDTTGLRARGDRGRVAQAADCGSVHEGSIPSGHPNCAGVVQRIEHFGPNEEMPGKRKGRTRRFAREEMIPAACSSACGRSSVG
jgi:hypothetical protein